MTNPTLRERLDTADQLFLSSDGRSGKESLERLARERILLGEALFGKRHPATLERRYDLSELHFLSSDFVHAFSELVKIKRLAEGVVSDSSLLLMLVNARLATVYELQGQSLEGASLVEDVYDAFRLWAKRIGEVKPGTSTEAKVRNLLGIVLQYGQVPCMYKFFKLVVTKGLLSLSDVLLLIEGNVHILSSGDGASQLDDLITTLIRRLAQESADWDRSEVLCYLNRFKGLGGSESSDIQELLAKAVLELYAGDEISNLKVVVENHIELAALYLQRGGLDEAHAHYELAMHFFNQKAAQEHRSSSTSSTLGEIAFVFGRLEESRELLKDALERSLDDLEDATETARIVHNLGTLALVGNQLEEAAQYLKNALELKRKSFGVEHQETQLTLIALGMLESSRGDLNSARGFFHEALHIESELFGEDTEQFRRIQREIEKLSKSAHAEIQGETQIFTVSEPPNISQQDDVSRLAPPPVEIDSPGFFKAGRGGGRV